MSDTSLPDLTPYQRIAIQMEAVVPLIRDLQAVLGEQVVRDALGERVRRQIADAERGPKVHAGPEAVAQGFEHFARGGALEYETLELSPQRAAVDVTRCDYQRLMERLGALDLGPALICAQDHATALRMGLRLDRTQTCMQGGSRCDFRFTPLGERSEP